MILEIYNKIKFDAFRFFTSIYDFFLTFMFVSVYFSVCLFLFTFHVAGETLIFMFLFLNHELYINSFQIKKTGEKVLKALEQKV